jgi:hypothetical protein
LADINKALSNKVKTDPYTKVPEHFHEFLEEFSQKRVDELALHHRVRINHRIYLKKVDGKEPKVL